MYEIHPAASLCPAMTDDQYRELVASIQRSGLLVPIELYEGKVIDGRHRLKACEELGVEPETIDIELSDETTPVLYVCDIHNRRDLSVSQRAAMAAIREEELVRIGKLKRQENLKQGDEIPEVPNLALRENTGKSRKIAADAAGVSTGAVGTAAKIKKESPELFEEVKDGKKSLNQAATELKSRSCQPQEPKCGGGKASVVQDSIGRKVPDHLREPFEKAVLLATIAKRLDPIRREVEEISKGPGGEYLSMSNINESVRMLKSYVTGGAYLTECPKCRGKVKDNCVRCSGAGYISKDLKGRLSDEEKGWLGI